MDFREILENIRMRSIKRDIDPHLEASTICMEDRSGAWVAGAKGFEGWRLAGNIYSSRSTLAMALGTDLEGITDSMVKAAGRPIPVEKIEIPDNYMKIETRHIPFPTYFEGDGGPYVTSGIFHAGYGGKRNLSFHRMMYMGGDRFAVRVVPRHMKALIRNAREDGKDLQAVVSIGADPYSLLAGSTSMGFGQDEMEVASALCLEATGTSLRAYEIGKEGLLAPEGTEIILKGHFIDEITPEGPFVDITSTYDHAGMNPGEPIFVVDEAFIREEPIMHILLPGGLEHYLMMGIPKEPAIRRSVGMVVPKVHAVRLTEGGCCWLHGIVSITQQKQGDSKNAIMAAFSGHPSMKKVIVVDGDIDIFDDQQVEWAIATRFQADNDIVIIQKARGSTLDPSSDPENRTTSKMGIDATMPLGREDDFRKIEVTTDNLNS